MKGKVRINQELGQKSKCELAPSMESWPVHTSTNVSLQAASAGQPRLHQMTLLRLSDDSEHCLVVAPLAHSVQNQVIRRFWAPPTTCHVVHNACLLMSNDSEMFKSEGFILQQQKDMSLLFPSLPGPKPVHDLVVRLTDSII